MLYNNIKYTESWIKIICFYNFTILIRNVKKDISQYIYLGHIFLIYSYKLKTKTTLILNIFVFKMWTDDFKKQLWFKYFFVICKNCLTIFNKHFRPCRFYIRIKFVKFEHQSILFCLVSLRKMCNFYDWLVNGLISVRNYFFGILQGYNARKVISEVYASFVLQCSIRAVM